jgi:hypothetical protein
MVRYEPHWGGQRGIIATAVVLCLPLAALVVYSLIVPAFAQERGDAGLETAARPTDG